MQSEKSYVVYKHTSPSGKVYIGITKRLKKNLIMNYLIL